MSSYTRWSELIIRFWKMGKPTRNKRTVAQKVLDFTVNVDAQKSLLNGAVLNRIMQYIAPEDKANVGQTCRFAREHLKSHVEYVRFFNYVTNKHVPLKAGQVIFFKDTEPENPTNGYYKVKKINASGVSLYRLTREYHKTIRKKHFFVEWEYSTWDEELLKRLSPSREFEWAEFSENTIDIVAENKRDFLPYWEKHCASVFPVRKKIAYDDVPDVAWNSKRRNKFIWILGDGSKMYPPCCY